MKEIILNYLKTDRGFENGVKLYNEYGVNMAFKTTLNRQGESDFNKRCLYEELRKIAEIHIDDFKFIMETPIAIISKKLEIKEPEQSNEPQITFKEIPLEIKRTIKLREEFPFLNSKDCPNEFKILLADRITAYHTYVEKHKELFDAATPEQLAEIAAEVVENYIENHEIWEELSYYKENGEVLGKHEIFAKTKREEELKAMETGEQIQLLNNLKNYIARSNKEVKDNPDADNSEKLAKIEQWQFELNILNGILKVPAKISTKKQK